MKPWQRLTAAWRALVSNSSGAYEHPNGSLTVNDLMRMGQYGGDFGLIVNDETAMKVGAVYSCLAKLGGAVAQMPIKEYRDGEAGRQEINPKSPIWWALNESPDPAWTASAWKQWIVRCVKLRGDQHTEILRRGAEVVGFKVHHPDNVLAVRDNGRLRYSCRDIETGRVYSVDQDDMLHFTGFGFDGLRSVSAIRWAARNAIASELGAAAYLGKTITEGGLPRVALEYPANLLPKDAQELRKAFVETYGGGEGGRLPLVLTHGGKAHELSISPVDMELLASRRMDKQTICEVMGVPPIIIGDSEKTSSWGSGVEQVKIAWVTFDLAPMVIGWAEEINRKLYRRAGRFVEFALDSLMQGDSKAQAEAFRAALGGPGTGDGWMAVNEVRKLKNLPKLADPEADKPFKAQRNQDTGTNP